MWKTVRKWTGSGMLLCALAGLGLAYAWPEGALGTTGSSWPPQESEPSPWSEPCTALTFEFALGDRLHLGQIQDPAVLRELHAQWKVVQRIETAPAPERPRLLGRQPAVLLRWGSGPTHTFRLAGRNQLHHPRWGRLILSPAWFRAVEAWASTQEDAIVRLGVENPFPASRLQALRRFQGLLKSPWVQGTLLGPQGRVEAHGSAVLKPLHDAFAGMYVPNQRHAGSEWGHSLRVQTIDDQRFELELRDGSAATTRPLRSALLQHEQWGLIWVSDEFRQRWLDLYRVPNPLQAVAPEDREAATQAAQRALEELALPTTGPFVYRTTDWDLEREAWVPVVRAIPAGSISLDWRGLWREVEISLPPTESTPLRAEWDQVQAGAPMLLWTDRQGVARILFGEFSKGLWLNPAMRVRLPRSPWTEFQQARPTNF